MAAALAKADGLAEKNLSPVPEGLLKEAQQAAEEQRSMPGVVEAKSGGKKPPLPAGLEKMFQQAEAEQEVEKKEKQGTEVPPAPPSPTLGGARLTLEVADVHLSHPEVGRRALVPH